LSPVWQTKGTARSFLTFQQEEKTHRTALRYVFPQEMEALLFWDRVLPKVKELAEKEKYYTSGHSSIIAFAVSPGLTSTPPSGTITSAFALSSDVMMLEPWLPVV